MEHLKRLWLKRYTHSMLSNLWVNFGEQGHNNKAKAKKSKVTEHLGNRLIIINCNEPVMALFFLSSCVHKMDEQPLVCLLTWLRLTGIQPTITLLLLDPSFCQLEPKMMAGK